MPGRAIFTLICTALLAFEAGAEVYTWKDAQGRTHFGDKPPVQSNARPLDLQINSISRPEIKSLDNSALSNRKEVVIYSTEWCGACRKAKGYFKQKQIPFKEYDVEKSTKGRKDYARLNGRGVPIILVGKHRMNGFSVSGFESIYRDR